MMTSAQRTAKGELEFIFYIDDDDAASYDMAERLGADSIVGPRIILSEMWNACWMKAHSDVFMHCGDDIVFRSEGWDSHVLDAFARVPDKIVLVHGRDGYQDANLATHGFYHRRWTEATGYLVPPYFSSDYNDLWWTEVADMISRRTYLHHVFTEHMHPVVGKGTWDQTHNERLARHQQDNVQAIYNSKTHERLEDANKLRAAIAAYTG
jgi:hypothetical protein